LKTSRFIVDAMGLSDLMGGTVLVTFAFSLSS